MIRLGVVVEGQTEVEFVWSLLADHLRGRGVEPTPIGLDGHVNVQRLVAIMVTAYRSFDAVTSLVDFYGFRGKGEVTADRLEEQITRQVQSRIGQRNEPKEVIPYVQKHEFEALLFTDVTAFSAVNAPSDVIDRLRTIRWGFATPEDIDDSPLTAPSKRIAALVPNYDKVVGGNVVALEVGLPAIRAGLPTLQRLAYAAGNTGRTMKEQDA